MLIDGFFLVCVIVYELRMLYVIRFLFEVICFIIVLVEDCSIRFGLIVLMKLKYCGEFRLFCVVIMKFMVDFLML